MAIKVNYQLNSNLEITNSEGTKVELKVQPYEIDELRSKLENVLLKAETDFTERLYPRALYALDVICNLFKVPECWEYSWVDPLQLQSRGTVGGKIGNLCFTEFVELMKRCEVPWVFVVMNELSEVKVLIIPPGKHTNNELYLDVERAIEKEGGNLEQHNLGNVWQGAGVFISKQDKDSG